MPKAPIPAGTKFGRLTVEGTLPHLKGKRRVYRCACDCGNTIEAVGSSLVVGDRASCGCLVGQSNVREIAAGTRFGRLTVLEMLPRPRQHKRDYRCVCDCGTETTVIGTKLRGGETLSCGCYQLDQSTTHGLSRHALYGTWSGMRSRCNNPRATSYRWYGARGITVDPRWDDFARFVADMGECPGLGYSIDRIDPDGPYSPENCRWATASDQTANRRPPIRNMREPSDSPLR